jgi:sugar phosphate isomerase/epimerase
MAPYISAELDAAWALVRAGNPAQAIADFERTKISHIHGADVQTLGLHVVVRGKSFNQTGLPRRWSTSTLVYLDA